MNRSEHQLITAKIVHYFPVKIYFPITADKLSKLHALGLEKIEGSILTPLEGLDKNRENRPEKLTKRSYTLKPHQNQRSAQ